MAKMTKAAKIADRRIDAAYKHHCCGIQIDIFDISKVFAVGRNAIANGATDEQLGEAIAAFVQSIRRN